MLRDAAGNTITNIDQWPRPKRDYQWRAGRSAMELARSWLATGAPACPPELRALLASRELTRGIEFVEGCPEFVTSLPEPGEGRNHDLWLRAHRADGTGVTVCIEAKADEPFGERVGDAIAAAKQRNPRTRMPARARALLQMLVGRNVAPEEHPWRDLRYQLITGVAGTLLQAKIDGSDTAAFVVQEFCGPHLDAARQQENHRDLEAFVRHVFPPADESLTPGWLASVPVARRSATSLLVGSIRSDLYVRP